MILQAETQAIFLLNWAPALDFGIFWTFQLIHLKVLKRLTVRIVDEADPEGEPLAPVGDSELDEGGVLRRVHGGKGQGHGHGDPLLLGPAAHLLRARRHGQRVVVRARKDSSVHLPTVKELRKMLQLWLNTNAVHIIDL